ncbi:hypothetical protein [Enterococcus sp. AZ126]|uniref:hypothetical protein n=1 Tax=Enterococcus sp. AZ126 TaxID=2774635 RepID=UPI003F1EEDD3
MKKLLYMLILATILSFFPMHTGFAVENEESSNGLVIQIEPTDKLTDKKISGKPTAKYPKTSESKNGLLPHLGQMITSYIILLSEIACLIIFCGVICFKKIYYNM